MYNVEIDIKYENIYEKVAVTIFATIVSFVVTPGFVSVELYNITFNENLSENNLSFYQRIGILMLLPFMLIYYFSPKMILNQI